MDNEKIYTTNGQMITDSHIVSIRESIDNTARQILYTADSEEIVKLIEYLALLSEQMQEWPYLKSLFEKKEGGLTNG